MGTIINDAGLPAPIMAALREMRSRYDAEGSDITSTTLPDAPRVVEYRRRYRDEIVETASSMMEAFDGELCHLLFELAGEHLNDPDIIVEKRYHAEIDGWDVSAKIDLLEKLPSGNWLLTDYKRMKTWEHVFALKKSGAKTCIKPERHEQLNIAAEILLRNGIVVERAEVVAWYKDWSPKKAKREDRYPETRIKTVPVPLWTPAERSAYISRRIKAHRDARERGIDVPCSASERWQKEGAVAVMKPGRKSALRLFDTEAEATIFSAKTPGTFIEHRPGEDTRCVEYCNVKQWCDYYRATYGGDDADAA